MFLCSLSYVAYLTNNIEPDPTVPPIKLFSMKKNLHEKI